MTTTRGIWVGLGLLGLSLTTETPAQPPPFGYSTGTARFTCAVVNSNEQVLTPFGGQCVAPPAGLSLYIVSITASATVISTTTVDQYLVVKSGTGGLCASNMTVVWASYSLAFTPVTAAFLVPIQVPSGHELCWQHAAAGNKTFIVTGYLAP